MKLWHFVLIVIAIALYLSGAGEYHFNSTLTRQYEMSYGLGYDAGFMDGALDALHSGYR